MSMTRADISKAESFLHAFFLDHPEASVDTAAREVVRQKLALHKSEISRIRMSIRQRISNAVAAPVLVRKPGVPFKPEAVVPPSQPFNGIKLSLANDPEKDLSAADVAVAVVPTVVPVAAPSPANKTKFLWEYAEAHPETHARDLNQMVIAKFGSGFFLPVVAEALRTARQVAGLPPIKQQVRHSPQLPPVQAQPQPQSNPRLDIEGAVRALATAIRAAQMHGDFTMTVDANGDYTWTIKGTNHV